MSHDSTGAAEFARLARLRGLRVEPQREQQLWEDFRSALEAVEDMDAVIVQDGSGISWSAEFDAGWTDETRERA